MTIQESNIPHMHAFENMSENICYRSNHDFHRAQRKRLSTKVKMFWLKMSCVKKKLKEYAV